jgi:cell division protein FtsB
MASNRKNQSAAIQFAPALKVAFLCLLFAGSAVGYVWQKSQIYMLGQQIRQSESHLSQLRNENQRLSDQLAILRSPVMLDQRARELNLGLVPAQPLQVWRMPEPAATGNTITTRQYAARQAGVETK